MSDLRQLPLFEPQSTADLNKHTPIKWTIKFFEEFLKSSGKTTHTVGAFMSDMNLVMGYLGDERAVSSFTTTLLDKFMYWLENDRGVPCSRKSYARRVTTLKVYFKWLHGLGVIPHDPAKAVLQRSGQAPLSDVLSPNQIRNAIAFTHGMKYKRTSVIDTRPELLFRLLLDTGIKKSEADRLLLTHIDRLNPQQPVMTIRQKTRNIYKERRIELDSGWIKLLDVYVEQYEIEDKIFTCTPRNLEYILSDIGEGAGIPFKLSFEIMRWTCGVVDFRRGIDEQTIREKLGLSEASWYETGDKIKRLSARLDL